MSKINKILLILVAVLLIALGVIIYWQKFGFEEPYYAVYLDTGDMYFGKLNYFPKLSLTDVWYIQRNPQDTQNPLSLSKFERVFWGPEDRLYLNGKNIVWKSKLKSTSPVLNFIKNPQAVQPASEPQVQSPSQNIPQKQSTSTSR